jgi:rhodanese-related sulfurtransferase
MKRLLSIITAVTISLIGFSINIFAAEFDLFHRIPDEIIVRSLKKRDPLLAISVEAVLYNLRQNQKLILVDVRSGKDFERLHIPGAINIPLHAVKTKIYLKASFLVLVNGGFSYAELEDECRRLAARGFKVSILDGGLPAWQRKDGKLTGDLFAVNEMKTISAPVFFREKDYENTLVIDISPEHKEEFSRLIPYAKYIPIVAGSDPPATELSKLIANHKNMPFQSVVIVNETGEQYEKAEKFMKQMGIEAYKLKGGLAGYQKYLEGLLLSWKPRDSRLKTVGDCKPCGEKSAKE